jgi:hypothetical protein
MKEILKETKDFEHSFEVKIAICSMLILLKDKNTDSKQEDALVRLS